MTEIKHTAFFSEGYRFKQRHRAELLARGISAATISWIEGHVDFVKGYYATSPPTRAKQRQLFADLAASITKVIAALEAMDDLTASTLEIGAFKPHKPHLPPDELLSVLRRYSSVASDLADAHSPASGPDSRQSTHMAMLVGDALRMGGHQLDEASKGVFVIATSIALDALGLGVAEPRNAVRRAMEKLNTDNQVS